MKGTVRSGRTRSVCASAKSSGHRARGSRCRRGSSPHHSKQGLKTYNSHPSSPSSWPLYQRISKLSLGEASDGTNIVSTLAERCSLQSDVEPLATAQENRDNEIYYLESRRMQLRSATRSASEVGFRAARNTNVLRRLHPSMANPTQWKGSRSHVPSIGHLPSKSRCAAAASLREEPSHPRYSRSPRNAGGQNRR